MKKTAIVTGASRGIGFAIAKTLAGDGYQIVILDVIDGQTAAPAMEEIRALGADCLYIQGSITDKAARENCVAETVKRFGGIDVLVNNAGVAPTVRADLLEMSEESFDRVVGINTKGTMFMTQAVAKQMLTQEIKDRRRGIIVNISSCSAVVSSIARGEYCVSKAGVSMLTKLYADRLAGESIFVYEIRPGVIATDMTATVTEKYDRLFASGAFPIPHWGQAQDIADAVSAFCGGKFLYSTGFHVDVDGGFHIQRL